MQHVPQLQHENFYLEHMTEFAKFAISLGAADFDKQHSSWPVFTDGSYKHLEKENRDICGWACVIVVENPSNATMLKPSGYLALAFARYPILDADKHCADKVSSGLAETVAIINTLLVIMQRKPLKAAIRFDALPIGRAVEGLYAPTAGLKGVIGLAIGLRQIAEQQTQLAFVHVNSHDCSPWNDAVDAHAKEACDGELDCAPTTLPSYRYGQSSIFSDWAWLHCSTPQDLFALGLPPMLDHWLQCTPFIATPLNASCLGVTPVEVVDGDEALLTLKMATANINAAVDDKAVRGVLGRDEFLKHQFHDFGLHVIGVQEANGRKAQTISSGNYVRLVVGPKDKAKVGDIDFW